MKIVDVGVVVELVAGNLDPAHLGTEELATPHLIDSEVTNALRRLVLRGGMTPTQGTAAMDGFLRLKFTRYPAVGLRRRMWELRDNLSAYDATYVALAEAYRASELLTTDARLANAPGTTCPIRVL